VFSDIAVWYGSVFAYKDKIKLAKLCQSSRFRKILMSVQMQLSTCAGPCITVLILRTSCTPEKGDFFTEILLAR